MIHNINKKRIFLLAIFVCTSLQFIMAQIKRPLMKDVVVEITEFIAKGNKFISICVLSFEGENPAVVKEAERLGGEILYRNDEISYLSVILPVDKIIDFVACKEIEAVMVDRGYFGPDQHTGMENDKTTSNQSEFLKSIDSTMWPPRPSDYPLHHLYHPWKDLDAIDFLKDNPTFDGRGVVIGLLEGAYPDILLPELKWSLDKNGHKVRKVIDVINASDPLEAKLNSKKDIHLFGEDFDRKWVDMNTVAESIEGKISIEGDTFVVPENGQYRIGFQELSGGKKTLLEKSNVKLGSLKKIGVLWDEFSDKVWVDTDLDGDFTDEKALEEYKIKGDCGLFGEDLPETPVRESRAFGIQIDKGNKFISINEFYGSHVTSTVGSAAANNAFGGLVNGVAPNAQFINIHIGNTKSTYLRALIMAFTDPRIDMILVEQTANVTGFSYYLKDGTSVLDLIQERLVKKYLKPFVIPAGNLQGLCTLLDHSIGESIFTIGAYQSKENVFINNGIIDAPNDDLHWIGSSGPTGNGGLKPDVLSPSNIVNLGTAEAFNFGTLKMGYLLPPPYYLSGGTSQATPVAAGSIALLLSAIKQNDFNIVPNELKKAILSSARYMPSLNLHDQGMGLIQVNKAWEIINQLSEKKAIPVQIEVEAPVKTATSHLLENPNTGIGLYEAGGWKPGDVGKRYIKLKRISGGKKPISFNVKWRVDDGTFSSDKKVILPLNKEVVFSVKVHPETFGIHSDVMILDDPDIPGLEKEVMATILVPETFNASNKYHIEKKEMLRRPNGRLSYIIEIPEGVDVLTSSISSSDPYAEIHVYFHEPDKMMMPEWNSSKIIYKKEIVRPKPGIWEVYIVEAYFPNGVIESLGNPLPDTEIKLGIDICKNNISTLEKTYPNGIMNGKHEASFELNEFNELASFEGYVSGGDIGWEHAESKMIKDKEMHIYEIKVDSGATYLTAKIQLNTDSNADIDITLIDPEGKNPQRDRINFIRSTLGKSYNSDESIYIENPMPGTWKAVVNGFLIPEGIVSYRYADIIQHPEYGSVSTTDISSQHKSGEERTIKAHVWLPKNPGEDREVVAVFKVLRTDVEKGKKPIIISQEVIHF